MNNAKQYADIGLTFYMSKNYPEAERNIKKAIELDSKEASYFNVLGLIHCFKYEYSEAVKNFEKAIELDPENSHYFNNLGLAVCNSSEDYSEGIPYYKKACELNPKKAIYFSNLGAVYSREKKYLKAEENFIKATELDPNEAQFFRTLGSSQMQLTKYCEAEKNFKKVIELNPVQASHFYSLGLVQKKQKKYFEAEKNFIKAIKLDSKEASYFYNLGLVQKKQKKYFEAEKSFKKVIELDSEKASYLYNLGLVQKKQKKYVDAKDNFEKATKLSPLDANYFNNLGLAYYKLKDYPKAIKNYNIAIQLIPEEPTFHNKLGISYFDNKDYNNAVMAFEKAVELRPNNHIYIGNLGMAAAEVEDYKKAEKNIKKALSFNENNAIIIRKLLEIYEIKNENKNYLELFLQYIKLIDEPFDKITKKINLLNIEELEKVTSVMKRENENISEIIKHSYEFEDSIRKSCLISTIKLLIYVRKFKKDLLVKKEDLTTLYQYTSIETLKSLLNINDNTKDSISKNNVNIRLYNTDYMNDPEEGQFLTKVLSEFVKTSGHQLLRSRYNTSHAFIASLTSENKKDEIPMWSTYGRNSQGVSIGFSNLPFYDSELDENSSKSLVRSEEEVLQNSNYDYMEERVQLYEVVYLNIEMAKDIKKIDNTNLKKIFNTINKISEICNYIFKEKSNTVFEEVLNTAAVKAIYNNQSQELKQDMEKDIHEKVISSETINALNKLPILQAFNSFISIELDKIRFLIKNSNYEYEKEYRLLKMVKDYKSFDSTIKYDIGNPKLYLEYPEAKLNEIIFGVNSDDCTKWRPIVELKSPDTNIDKVTNSTINLVYA